MLAEGCLQSVIWACCWRCPGAATPAPTPTRPPTATWPGKSVSEHRVDAPALTAQLPLNHIEGNLRGLGLPGNGPLCVSLVICSSHTTSSRARSTPACGYPKSVGQRVQRPRACPVLQPLGDDSSLQRGIQPSCPFLMGLPGISDATAPAAGTENAPWSHRRMPTGTGQFSEEQASSPAPLCVPGMAPQVKCPRSDDVGEKGRSRGWEEGFIWPMPRSPAL